MNPKELVIWQKSMDLYSEVCRLIELFPDDLERIEEEKKKYKDLSVNLPYYIEEVYSKIASAEILRSLSLAKSTLKEISNLFKDCIKNEIFEEDDTSELFMLIESIETTLSAYTDRLVYRNEPQKKVEAGSRKEEVGSRKEEGGSQKDEGGSQREEGGGKKEEGGSQKAEGGSQKEEEPLNLPTKNKPNTNKTEKEDGSNISEQNKGNTIVANTNAKQ